MKSLKEAKTERLQKKLHNSPLLRNTAASFSLRVTGAALLFIFNWLIVRSLGTSNAGVIFLGLTIINIAATIFLFGVDQYSLRSVSSTDNPDGPHKTFIDGLQFTFWAALLGSALIMVLAVPLGHVFNSEPLTRVLLIMALAIPLINLNSFLGGMIQAQRRFVEAVFILVNSQYLIIVPLFFVAYLSSNGNLGLISWMFVIGMLISLVLNTAFSYKIYLEHLREVVGSRLGLKSMYRLAHNSRHLLWSNAILVFGVGGIDILLVGHFLPSSDVSIYAVATKIAKLLTFSLFAINTVLAPAISRNFGSHDKTNLNRDIQKATVLAIIYSMPLFILFLAFPALLLRLFGSDFVTGVNVLRLLVIGQIINVLTGAVAVTMSMLKLERVLSIIGVVALTIQISLGIFLTPRYGIIGTSISTIVGMSLINMIGAFYLLKVHGISVFPSKKLLLELARGVKS